MKSLQADVLVEAMTEYRSAISPLYADLMAKAGDLALNDVTIDEMRQRDALNVSNYQIITGFMNHLPVSKNDGFKAENALTARKLQSSVVWESYQKGHNVGKMCGYVIGQAEFPGLVKDGGERSGAAYLYGPAYGSGDIFIRRTWPAEAASLRAGLARILQRPFSNDELAKAYVSEWGQLSVSRCTPGSIKTTWRPKPTQNKLPRQRRRMDIEERADSGTIFVSYGGESLGRFDMSNGIMERYAVFDHLIQLAVRFGKTAELEHLIRNNVQDPQEPLDTLLDAIKTTTADD